MVQIRLGKSNALPTLFFCSLVSGSCSGLFLSQRATVLGDLIGEHRVAQAFGLQLVVTGIGTMTGRLLGGKGKLEKYHCFKHILFSDKVHRKGLGAA